MESYIENNIIKTKELEFDEDVGGIGTLLYEFMKKHGNRAAQIEIGSEKSDTFESLLLKCVRTAIALEARGIKKGDIVALCTAHHINGCVPLLAALFLGALPCALESSLAVPDCAHMISKIRPKLIFLQESKEDLIKSCFEMLNWQTDTVIFERDFETEFLTPKPNEDSFKPLYIKDLQETAMIYFSSGSTGLPKAVCINHYCFVATCNELTNEEPSSHSSLKERVVSSTAISYSTWYWISSGMVLTASTFAGGCRLLVDKFDPVQLWYYIDKYKITFLFLDPFKIIEWCESEKPKDVDVSSLKFIMSGGSVLPLEYILKMKKKLPWVRIGQGYAQSEVGSITKIFNLPGLQFLEKKPTTVGLPIRGFWYKIVDPETRKVLGFNQPGELCIKSRRVMNGYYNDETDTKNAFDEDSFLKTGDMLYYDEDFCFYYVQRIKEILKYRGWNISPLVIENVLLQHPAVKSAVVIGKPDKVDDDHPVGVVILKGNCDATEEELLNFVSDRVEDRQRLRGGIKFVDSYPLGPTGKVKRNVLKEIVLNS